MKKLIVGFLLFILASQVNAQELQAKLTVLANKVTTKVDKKIFQTLQTGLTNFLKMRLNIQKT